MKHSYLSILTLFFLSLFNFACAQQEEANTVQKDFSQIELSWQSFPDAVAQAKTDKNKKLLVFVYTDWCGYCRKFQDSTYQDNTIKAYLGEKFVLAKVNAEGTNEIEYFDMKFTESQLAQALRASGFPTHVVMKPNEDKLDYIEKIPGYVPPNEFIHILKYFGENAYTSKTFNEYMGRS